MSQKCIKLKVAEDSAIENNGPVVHFYVCNCKIYRRISLLCHTVKVFILLIYTQYKSKAMFSLCDLSDFANGMVVGARFDWLV